MTESTDETQRPVSVAELLARNGANDGKISGHRRRMRGNADAIPVAELTGEIPVIRDKKGGRARPNPAPTPVPEAAAPPEGPATRSYLRSNADALFGGDSMADEAARRGTPPQPTAPSSMASPLRNIFPPTPTPEVRPGEPRKSIDFNDATGIIAPVTGESKPAPTPEPKPEAVRPAPAPPVVHTPPAAPVAPVVPIPPVSRPEPAPEPEPDAVVEPQPKQEPLVQEDQRAEYEEDEYDEYGRASAVEWTSHDAEQDVEDDEFGEEEYQLEHELRELVGAHGNAAESDVSQRVTVAAETKSPAATKAERREKVKTYLRGTWIASQYLLATAAGAGLFLGFRELWGWNQGIALVLGVLFIAILVASLWVIRKTVDLTSILIAIVVGALIAFGPLVLMLQAVD